MFFSQKCFFILLLTAILTVTAAVDRNPKKRQIYREQVLPHAGGKIPETAFETDRLFLNRLQSNGISVPDGVVTEQRNPHVYQYHDKSPRVLFKIALSSDGRYTPTEGRYNHRNAPAIETTYLYPQIHGHLTDATPAKSAYPTYRQLQLHNSQLNQVKLQPKKKTQYLDITPSVNKGHGNAFRTQAYQNFNIINAPLVPASATAAAAAATASSGSANQFEYLAPSADSSAHLFNDFDELFNHFNLHENSAAIYSGGASFGAKHKI
uniref:Riboflavin biosynthesis protein RibD n=1 Tax=Zeugodacus cucurbitae TaxID=28588 RepID=A0A0A1WMW1_ZEUCU